LTIFSALEGTQQTAKMLYPLPEIILPPLCGDAGRRGRLRRDQPLARRTRAFCPTSMRSTTRWAQVIRVVDPELFKASFTSWVEGLREDEPDIVAIDGKASRRTHARKKGREPLHLVSAWATRQRLVLGQEAVAGKSNEITAIPLLLERLALAGHSSPSPPSVPRTRSPTSS
jgi:hypothetical protein